MKKEMLMPSPVIPKSHARNPVRVKGTTSISERILSKRSVIPDEEVFRREYRQVAKQKTA